MTNVQKAHQFVAENGFALTDMWESNGIRFQKWDAEGLGIILQIEEEPETIDVGDSEHSHVVAITNDETTTEEVIQ